MKLNFKLNDKEYKVEPNFIKNSKDYVYIKENELISIGKGIYKASYVDNVREVMSILNCETAIVRFNNKYREGGIITFEFGNVKIAICYANEPVLEETVNIPIIKL